MRTPPLPKVILLEAEVADLKARLGEAFNVEEMDAIREQLSERAEAAERAHEELEWNVRLELARVREAEQSCAHAAQEMRRAATALASLLGENENVVSMRVPSRRRLYA
jgi:DNA repair exonuclease SbcCD ATPase subunit